MARFRFSMQNLLNIKEQLENQKKMEYATAQEQVRRQQEKLEQLKLSKEELFEQGRKLRQTTLDFLAIKENDASLVVMDERIRKQEYRVESAMEDLEEARLALQTAMQERKTLEKLKEKAYINFLEDERAAESKEVDELVSYTYGLRMKENTDGGSSGY